MQKICTKCHYIGKSKQRYYDATTAIVFFFALSLITFILGFWNPYFIIGLYVFMFALLATYNLEQTKCPKCKEDTFLYLNSLDAQNLVLVHNLKIDHKPENIFDIFENYNSLKYLKRKICKNCFNTETKDLHKVCELTWGVMLIVVGIVTIPLALFNPYFLIFNFIYLFIGIIFSVPCFADPVNCKKCKEQKLIPINSSKARNLAEVQNILNTGHVIDPVAESKLYTIHENIVFVYLIAAWILSAILMIFLFFYFKGL